MRSIKRTGLAVLLAASMLLGVQPAEAKSHKHTVVMPYSHVGGVEVDGWVARCGGSVVLVGAAGYSNAYERADFWPATGDRSVSLQITDRISRQRVIGLVWYEDRSGRAREAVFCGATPKPLDIAPYQDVVVWAVEGVSDAGPSVLTSGRITATFSG